LIGTIGRREDVGRGCRWVNIVPILCIHIFKWKMRPVATISKIGGGRRMIERVNSTMIHCKNFVNVTMYPKHNSNKKTNMVKYNHVFQLQHFTYVLFLSLVFNLYMGISYI
jgi:hypothetical protein